MRRLTTWFIIGSLLAALAVFGAPTPAEADGVTFLNIVTRSGENDVWSTSLTLRQIDGRIGLVDFFYEPHALIGFGGGTEDTPLAIGLSVPDARLGYGKQNSAAHSPCTGTFIVDQVEYSGTTLTRFAARFGGTCPAADPSAFPIRCRSPRSVASLGHRVEPARRSTR